MSIIFQGTTVKYEADEVYVTCLVQNKGKEFK